jgi:hypothetical protein
MSLNIFKNNSDSSMRVDTLKKTTINIKPSVINEHFQCGICQGYIIDATTIIDCLHSFCKSCIVHFLKTIDHRCPTCNINLKGDLDKCLRSDSFLQRLIYRLIPNLLNSEIKRRDQFYFSEKLSTDLIINNNTLLNVKLVNVPCQNENSDLNKFEKENQKRPDDTTNSNNNIKYIQCIAQTPVSILSKLIRNKYDIPLGYKIKLFYCKHRLDESESLIQVFTSFLLNKDELVQINYEIKKKKKLFKNIKNSIVNENNRESKENNREFIDLKTPKLNKLNTANNSKNPSQKSSMILNKTSSSSVNDNGSTSSKKTFLSEKKMSLVSASIQNENNLLARFRPIRKKDPSVEQAKTTIGTSSNVLAPAKGKFFFTFAFKGYSLIKYGIFRNGFSNQGCHIVLFYSKKSTFFIFFE